MATSVPAPMAMPISARVRAGRVVDAVADHGDFALSFAVLRMTAFLAVWQDARDHLVYASLARRWRCAVRSLSPVSITT